MIQDSPIPGFEKLYAISVHGVVTALNKVVLYRRHGVDGSKKLNNKKIKTSISKCGYEKVTLSKDGEKFYFTVHRLVALSFISNPNNKPHVNHIDGNKLNNRIDNLEWCTMSENMQHAFKNKLHIPSGAKGERSARSKLKEVDVLEIRNLISLGCSVNRLALKYGVNRSSIRDIRIRKTWSHI